MVTMKICSLDTEVTATAPHQVAICALCVLHHCKIQTDQTFELSVLLKQQAVFVFWDSQGVMVFLHIPTASHRRISFIFTKLLSSNHSGSTASLYVSDDRINLALVCLICWHGRHIVAASTVGAKVKRDRGAAILAARATRCAACTRTKFKKTRGSCWGKFACPNTLIFNQGRAFSLKLCSVLFGSPSHRAIFSLTPSPSNLLLLPLMLAISVLYLLHDTFLSAVPARGRKDKGGRCGA